MGDDRYTCQVGARRRTSNPGGYTIHTFTSSGTLTVTTGGDVEYLVVGGGGGGGITGSTSGQTGGSGIVIVRYLTVGGSIIDADGDGMDDGWENTYLGRPVRHRLGAMLLCEVSEGCLRYEARDACVAAGATNGNVRRSSGRSQQRPQ